jgi:hypothetical protein
MKLAPAGVPAVVDLGELRGRVGGEDAPSGLPVGGELDRAGGLGFLEALRRKLDEAGAELLRLACGDGDRSPDQWKALFSFSKKLGSCR